MATKAQLKAYFIRKKASSYAVTKVQWDAEFQTMSTGEVNKFEAVINGDSVKKKAQAMDLLTRRAQEKLAGAEADTILADDTIDFNEIEKFL